VTYQKSSKMTKMRFADLPESTNIASDESLIDQNDATVVSILYRSLQHTKLYQIQWKWNDLKISPGITSKYLKQFQISRKKLCCNSEDFVNRSRGSTFPALTFARALGRAGPSPTLAGRKFWGSACSMVRQQASQLLHCQVRVLEGKIYLFRMFPPCFEFVGTPSIITLSDIGSIYVSFCRTFV
jgi:hypothetical protein